MFGSNKHFCAYFWKFSSNFCLRGQKLKKKTSTMAALLYFTDGWQIKVKTNSVLEVWSLSSIFNSPEGMKTIFSHLLCWWWRYRACCCKISHRCWAVLRCEGHNMILNTELGSGGSYLSESPVHSRSRPGQILTLSEIFTWLNGKGFFLTHSWSSSKAWITLNFI